MSVRTILQRTGRAGAWILVGLQPGLHIRRRPRSRHKADAYTNHHARREPLRFSLQATERLIVTLGSSYLTATMSALGQKQTCPLQEPMSALPPKADMCGATRPCRNPRSRASRRHVRFTPESDIKRGIVKCPLWANSGYVRLRF